MALKLADQGLAEVQFAWNGSLNFLVVLGCGLGADHRISKLGCIDLFTDHRTQEIVVELGLGGGLLDRSAGVDVGVVVELGVKLNWLEGIVKAVEGASR